MREEDLPMITPAEILPRDGGYMNHQIYGLLIDHLLDASDWEKYGVWRFRLNRFDGVIFVRRYLNTLAPIVQQQIENTQGKVEVKSYFRELFNKLKEKSQEEIVAGLVSGAKQYGLAAFLFLIKMVQEHPH